MIKRGIVSVTFRNKSVDEIIDITKRAQLDAIEWGGDIHVPPNNLEHANEVAKKTKEANLTVAAYGSYYRLGTNTDFKPILETAKILDTKVIRTWLGVKGSANTSKEERATIVREGKEISKLALDHGIKVAFECHGGTLSDTLPSYIDLLEEIETAYAYFQPYASMPMDEVNKYLDALIPYLTNIHVFNWKLENNQIHRHAMEDGGQYWIDIFNYIKEKSKIDHYALLEFVKGDSDLQFLEDAKALKDFLK